MVLPTPSDSAAPTDESEPVILDLNADGDPAAVAAVPAPSTPACSVEEMQKLCDTLALQHAETKRERDEFARQLAALPRSSVDAEKALLAIRQARDTLLARNHELLGKISSSEDQLAELGNQHEDLTRAHTALAAELHALRKENEELHRKALDLSEQKTAYLEAERSYVSAMAEAGRQISSLTEERDDALARCAELEARTGRSACEDRKTTAAAADQLVAAQKARDIALASATAAQRQIEQLVADRDALRKQFTTEHADLRAQIAVLHARLHGGAPASESDEAPVEAEAKPAGRRDAGLAAINKRVAALRENPADADALEQLGEQLQALAKRSQAASAPASAALASTCAGLVSWLRKMPAKIPPALDTFEEALALLGQLAAIKDKTRLPDPTGAVVYAVDADVDNCECIAMAFEKVTFQTKYAVKPEAGLADLATGPCDLIVLDVDLAGMDGFELHSRIRALEPHRKTPVIFLSGHLSIADRVAALEGSNNRFVAKPYNLNDLSLKALLMIVQARLA